MSQKTEGLLNEEEVKSYLNETFNLKLTRDAFINPKKDIVMELYTKFLDFRNPKWRQVKNPKAGLLFIMVKRIRFLTQGYITNDQTEFHLGDLVLPERRRTNFFLNVLIFIKEQADDIDKDWQRWIKDWQSNQDIARALDQELEEAREELETLAIKKSQAKSADELKEEIRIKKALGDEYEERWQQTELEKERIKQRIQTLKEQKEELDLSNLALKEQNQQKENTLRILDDGLSIKKKNADLVQSISKCAVKIQATEENTEKLRSKNSEIEKFLCSARLDQDVWLKEAERTKALVSKYIERKASLEAQRELLISTLSNYKTEEMSLKGKISSLDDDIYKKSMQNRRLQKQAEADMEQAKYIRQKEAQEHADELNDLEKKLVHLEKLLAKLKEDRANKYKQHAENARNLELRVSSALGNYQDWAQSDRKAIEELLNIEKHIDDLMGAPITPSTSALIADHSIPANRTYIVN